MDWKLIDTLLSVVHGAATAGPKYANVVALAEAELVKQLDLHKPVPEYMAPVGVEPPLVAAEPEPTHHEEDEADPEPGVFGSDPGRRI